MGNATETHDVPVGYLLTLREGFAWLMPNHLEHAESTQRQNPGSTLEPMYVKRNLPKNAA